MPETPIPYQNPSWAEQARGVTQSANTPVPSSQAPSAKSESANPVLDSLAEAVRHAQSQVEASAKQLQTTPQYTKSATGSPVMPVQGKLPLQDASIHNLDNQHPTTRAGARNKAVGQIAAQAGNIIGSFFKKKQEEKTQQLAQDIHRSMELNEGIDQAKQVLQQDPNNIQAKAQLQKNTALLNGLLNGKNGKAIAKAYDITFGPEAQAQAEKNGKAPEKQAMTQAMKQIQQDKATQMQGQLPSQMQVNPAHEQAQKNLLAVQKQADDLTKTYTSMATAVMKEQGAEQRTADTNASRERVAATNVEGKLKAQSLKDRDASLLNQQRHNERMAEIGAGIAGRFKAAKELQNMKMAGDQKQKMAKDIYDKSKATTTALEGDIEKEMTNLRSLKPTDDKYEDKVSIITDRISDLNSKLKTSREGEDMAAQSMYGDPGATAAQQLIFGADNE